jgi:hypothetical protein
VKLKFSGEKFYLVVSPIHPLLGGIKDLSPSEVVGAGAGGPSEVAGARAGEPSEVAGPGVGEPSNIAGARVGSAAREPSEVRMSSIVNQLLNSKEAL